jgi:urease accessory protein
MGLDVTAFGLPHADQPFVRGSFRQHIEVPGVWLERGRVDATDAALLDGPLGLAGQRCMASLFFVAGSPLTRERRETALEAARGLIDTSPLVTTTGATAPGPQVVVVRVLSPVVEPAMALLQQVWGAWRQALWDLPAKRPRIWSM